MMSRIDSRNTSAMRTAQVSELKDRLEEVIEAVKNGETVEIREGNTSLAELVPHSNGTDEPEQAPRDGRRPDQSALHAHLDELVRQGKARRRQRRVTRRLLHPSSSEAPRGQRPRTVAA